MPHHSLLEKFSALQVARSAAEGVLEAFKTPPTRVFLDSDVLEDKNGEYGLNEIGVIDAILDGAPYRHIWIKVYFLAGGVMYEPPAEIEIMANRVFVGVVLAMLPLADGSMHGYK